VVIQANDLTALWKLVPNFNALLIPSLTGDLMAYFYSIVIMAKAIMGAL